MALLARKGFRGMRAHGFLSADGPVRPSQALELDWPDEIPESGWQYGSNLAFMRRLVERWRYGFDWRAQEGKLNALDQFQVPLDGIKLHFIHQPGVGPTHSSSMVGRGPCGSSSSSSHGSRIRRRTAPTRRRSVTGRPRRRADTRPMP